MDSVGTCPALVLYPLSQGQSPEHSSGQRVQGVVYVAYGSNAVGEAEKSIQSLEDHHPEWPIVAIGDEVKGAQRIEWSDMGRPGRWAKVNLLHLSPFEQTLLLDADTRVHGKLDIGFRILNDGWDLVMVPSRQMDQPLHSIFPDERKLTLDELADPFPLMLNTGVMWFGKSEAMRRLFAEWRAEWRRFEEHDQGALLRALAKCPVRLWLLGPPYNGGEIVEHRFGKASQ